MWLIIKSSLIDALLILIGLGWFFVVVRSLHYALKSEDSNTNIKILSALGIIATPFIVGYIGWQIQSAIKEQDIDLAYVKVAVSILQNKNIDGNNSKDLRKWALEILKKKSPIPFGEKVQDGFIDGSLTLPYLISVDDLGSIEFGSGKGNFFVVPSGSFLVPTTTPLIVN